LSNGLNVDSSGYLLINAGGGAGYQLTNGLSLDSSGNLLVDCVSGCSGSAYTLPAATSSTLGGVMPDGTSIVNSSGAISVTPTSIGLGNVTNNAQVTSVTGTANEITVTGTTTPTLSIPSTFIAPGTISASTSIDATKLVGNLPALNGASLTSVNAATLGSATFAAPGAIGGTTAAVGTFTTIAAPIHTGTSETLTDTAANTDLSTANTTPTVTGASTTVALATTTPTNVGNAWTYTLAATETGAGTNGWVGAVVTMSGWTGCTGNNAASLPITASTTTTVTITNASGSGAGCGGSPVIISTGVSSSPLVKIAGTVNTGSAGTLNSAADYWTLQDVIGSVAPNPTSTLTFAHTGSSGAAAVKATSFLSNLTTQTGTYAAALTDSTILCNAASTPFTVTLPATGLLTGQVYNVKNINAATCTVSASVGIDGGTVTNLGKYQSVTLIFDGAQFWQF